MTSCAYYTIKKRKRQWKRLYKPAVLGAFCGLLSLFRLCYFVCAFSGCIF
jgi:hypothetical protein